MGKVFIMNLPCLAFIILAGFMMYHKIPGHGWPLFLAAISIVSGYRTNKEEID